MPDKYVFPVTSLVIPADVHDAVMSAVHSKNDHYQYALITGGQCWSGGDLQGKAREYSGRYGKSRRNLMRRINERLQPFGWHATLAWVMINSRWNSRLVLTDNHGNAVDWISEKLIVER